MSKCVKCGEKGLFLKLTEGGLCLKCANARIRDLEEALTPEMKSIVDAHAELDKLKKDINQKSVELHEVESQYADKSRKLMMLDDEIEMESFSLYRPKYDFANSDMYKSKLDTIRENQKQMIRDKTAAVCDTQWRVEGSMSKGKAFATEMIKLFLRSFNNECDMAIQSVRFSNFDRCNERIEKSFEMINKLGKTNTVHLSQQYKKLKLEELALAYEYQQKKQEEKEELAALRAQHN